MLEALATAFVLLFAGSVGALVALRRTPGRGLAAGALGLAALCLVAGLAGAAALRRIPPQPPQPAELPLEANAEGYIGSDACRACHPRQHETWHDSYHRTMTQDATPEAVLGDFDDARLSFDGVHYRLYERDGRFFGEVDSPRRRAPRVSPLEQTTGSHHMQVYWLPTGEGRTLEAFPLVWVRELERWIPRTAAFVTPPQRGEPAPSIWNNTCIGCHTTRPRPRLRPGQGGLADSHVGELGIACEACHGPGAEHALANRSPARRWAQHGSGRPDPTITNPEELSHERSAQVCGQCHSVKTFHSFEDAKAWARRGSPFVPGEDLDAAHSVITPDTRDRPYVRWVLETFPDIDRGSFWSDGIVRVTGREYNALLEAPCFERGEIACTSCHDLHQQRGDTRPRTEWADDQLAPGMRGDAACVQCHGEFASDARVAEHSRHPAASSGSRCQNCHMPHTAYGLLKAVRAHEISTPRILTAGPGSDRPNACNLCHLDRPLAWSAEHLAEWTGAPMPELGADDRRVPTGPRWALEGDAGVRALVAWSMGWPDAQQASGREWLVPYLAQLMQDPYDAVRLIAHRSYRTLPDAPEVADFDPLAPPDQREAALRALRGPDLAPLDRATFERLLAGRDTRPINLAE